MTKENGSSELEENTSISEEDLEESELEGVIEEDELEGIAEEIKRKSKVKIIEEDSIDENRLLEFLALRQTSSPVLEQIAIASQNVVFGGGGRGGFSQGEEDETNKTNTNVNYTSTNKYEISKNYESSSAQENSSSIPTFRDIKRGRHSQPNLQDFKPDDENYSTPKNLDRPKDSRPR